MGVGLVGWVGVWEGGWRWVWVWVWWWSGASSGWWVSGRTVAHGGGGEVFSVCVAGWTFEFDVLE